VIHTPEDYYELTFEYLKECASHNVLYVEAMVSSTHAKAKGMTYHSFLDSVHQASLDAERDFGIVSRYLMNGIRHLGAVSVQGTAEEVLNNPHPALVGFGLAGDELHFPPHLFTKTFDMLKKESYPITVHAGEWDGPENIRNAIHLLHPTRLGHGVRSIEDLDLVKEIVEKDILLETCPKSNIATKIYENYESHPVKKLYELGVKVTVNSDDPPFFNATIQGEYDAMKNLGFTEKNLIEMTRNAIESSFLDQDKKSEILTKLD
jgi:adenosine deaminase